jgi:hypothetical protein
MPASRRMPVFGLIEGRVLALVNPLADVEVELGDDDQMD